MFSGIVEGTALVIEITAQPGGALFILDLQGFSDDLKKGDSVSINGVCLTVADIQGTNVSFNIITETLRKTNLGALQKGSKVNVERSLRLGDRIEGHMVQGHIQAVAPVSARIATDKDFKLTFQPSAEILAYIAPLGSVAINGVSLTVAEVTANTFSVALIPMTLERTNLGDLQVGDSANIETDMMARQMIHWLKMARQQRKDVITQ